MYVLIAYDNQHGVLHPIASPYSEEGPAAERLRRAADFVSALVKCGSLKTYELKSDEWILEVQVSDVANRSRWTH